MFAETPIWPIVVADDDYYHCCCCCRCYCFGYTTRAARLAMLPMRLHPQPFILKSAGGGSTATELITSTFRIRESTMVTLSSEVCCDGFRQAESSVSNRETFQNETPMEIYRDILCAVVLVELRAIALLMPPTLARLASIFFCAYTCSSGVLQHDRISRLSVLAV